MQTLAFYATLALTLSSCALAQSIQNFVPCKFGATTSVGVTNGIEVRRVSITDNRTDYGATVFLPTADQPTPGILFAHSAMKGPEGSTDLLRFAYALARAGAASIVLDGTMSWNQPNDTPNANQRSPHLLSCAGQWLLLNSPIDRNRIAHAGYHGQWGGGETPGCMAGEVPCWNLGDWLNFGESSDYETEHTKLMFTRAGQLEFANFARRHLKLSEVRPEWLDEPAQQQ
jgi:hypothetical protein